MTGNVSIFASIINCFNLSILYSLYSICDRKKCIKKESNFKTSPQPYGVMDSMLTLHHKGPRFNPHPKCVGGFSQG